jgi:outer membrane protein assembly factor BamD (BamD/ComL family)
VLRIDALAKGGRLDDARKYAQEFLRRHPNSVLAARVQSFAKR